MRHTLNINGTVISAESGDTLVDAALSARILIPHDCATGQCETCRVRIPWGQVDDNGTAYGDTVLACQARVANDAAITFETTPPVIMTKAKVEAITELSHDVVELILRMKEPLDYRPGQYARLALDGFPPREYSYSDPMQTTGHRTRQCFRFVGWREGKSHQRWALQLRLATLPALPVHSEMHSCDIRKRDQSCWHPRVLVSHPYGH